MMLGLLLLGTVQATVPPPTVRVPVPPPVVAVAPSDSVAAADARCLSLMIVASQTMDASSDTRSVGYMFYLGRINARDPDADYRAIAMDGREQLRVRFASREALAAELLRCVQPLRTAGDRLRGPVDAGTAPAAK